MTQTTSPRFSLPLATIVLFAASTIATPPLSQAASPPDAGNWPRFRGPESSGVSAETGLLAAWPPDGPKMAWQFSGLGKGYSSVSIADGRLYTMGDRSARGQDAAQHVMAVDLATRKGLWSTPIGPTHRDGPRATPTVDGNMVYALGTDGDLVCLAAADGRIVWRKHLVRDFGGQMMSGWKYSESPLIDGDRLIVTPGAADAMMVALDKKTGSTLWKSSLAEVGPAGKDGAGYASAVVADIEGVRQYITVVGRGAIAVEAATGKFLWAYNRIANRVANIPSPIVRGNEVFVTTSYKTGSALLRLHRKGDRFDVEEVYFLEPKDFENHHGGVVLVGDYLYGGDGQNNGAPVCLEFATGKIRWKEEPLGRRSAAVLFADGNLYFRYEDGLVALIKASPERMEVVGRLQVAADKSPAWAHPVIHAGQLYLRHNDMLYCYDIAQR